MVGRERGGGRDGWRGGGREGGRGKGYIDVRERGEKEEMGSHCFGLIDQPKVGSTHTHH